MQYLLALQCVDILSMKGQHSCWITFILCVIARAHWYLVVICFPWLETPVREDWGIQSTHGNSGVEKKRCFQAAGPATDDGKETAEADSASADVRRGGETCKGHFSPKNPASPPDITRCTSLLCAFGGVSFWLLSYAYQG